MRRVGTRVGIWAALLAWGCEPGSGPALSVVRVSVSEDRFEDGQLNPGDRARVTVFVRNAGTEPDTGMSCAVISETPGVSLVSDTRLYLGFCAADCRGDFRVEVAPDVAPGSEARFRCAVDGAGSLSWAVPIVAPEMQPEVVAVAVVDDPTADGVLNPGEGARIQVSLRNEGRARLGSSRCVVGSDTAGIQVSPSAEALSFNGCRGNTDCGTSSFRLTVSPEVAPGTVAALSCLLVEDSASLVFPLALRLGVEAPTARPRVDAVVLDQVPEGGLAPGGSGRVRVTLSNVGLSRLPAAGCAVESETDWLRINSQDGRLSWSGCAADADCRTSSFRVSATPEAPLGGTARLRCALEDDLGAVWPLAFELPPLAE